MKNAIVHHAEKDYKKQLEEIESISLSNFSDSSLKEKSQELSKKVGESGNTDSIISEAFALVRETAYRVIGEKPFFTQVLAAIGLHKGLIIDMKTGEGKTLAATMPVYLNALSGKGVHILTFNDYLAERDCKWMGDIYKFLGLSCSYITEGMDKSERRAAYNSDVLYITAREAGFDYLRDFLAMDVNEIVQKEYNYAIIDEADSIMIDEARIPLVIAGKKEEADISLKNISELIKSFKEGDYEFDQYNTNIFLTENGIVKCEKYFNSGNLYHMANQNKLVAINSALYAEKVLKRDKDYIVRNNKIEIVDEFTGRVAEKRNFMDSIQKAVEIKEGIISDEKGVILGSTTVQHFLNLYPKLGGMTGTAASAANEFGEFYGREVTVVPTYRPVTRNDRENIVFTHREAKHNALVEEIRKAYLKRQPVLIGTGSVEESESLSEKLKEKNIPHNILNAKNDYKEAGIIADAGMPGAVTVSTNMAGRGVDIKLGGKSQEAMEEAVKAGGLYVIGTNLHESARVDEQLKGRSGRLGDTGETVFYLALDDELFKKYDLTTLIPKEEYPSIQDGPVTTKQINKALLQLRKFVESNNSDTRSQMVKYNHLVDIQRRIIHKKKMDILQEKDSLKITNDEAINKFNNLSDTLGEQIIKDVWKKLSLYYINKCWAEYLDYLEYVKGGIHLVVIGRKDPTDEFHKAAVEGFDNMQKNMQEEAEASFIQADISKDGIDFEKEGLQMPASTWTYLINENTDQFSSLPRLIKSASNQVKDVLFSFRSLFKKINKK